MHEHGVTILVVVLVVCALALAAHLLGIVHLNPIT